MRTRLLLCMLLGCFHWGINAQGLTYSIGGAEDNLSRQWATYLYNHLNKRSTDKSKVLRSDDLISSHADKKLHLEVDPELEYDYCFSKKGDALRLRVKNKQVMLFVTYQLIESIGQTDPNIIVQDLPPAFINFSDQCRSFDFGYREPHLEPNTDAEYAAVLGANNLDDNWGIWGHNLHKVLVEDPAIYARVDGASNKQQYCFSSLALYGQLKQYIGEQFGDGRKKPYWFMIAPNDNDLVCLCEQCLELGNTNQSATPAVGYLVNKLANEYPEHHFFTLAYRTTQKAPQDTWVANTGVFFTTIDLPKGITLEGVPKFYKWKKELGDWREMASQIYLWDYISNFDDYLSPLPILKGFQLQLASYKKAGVNGMFLNGSGYDYSPFDDVKTYVLSALMIDKDVDVEILVSRYLDKFYPKSSQLLINYYLELEDQYAEINTPWPLYGGFDQIAHTYLHTDQFVCFYKALIALLPQTSGAEHLSLDKLITALSYTRLQIAYHQDLGEQGGLVSIANQLHLKSETKEVIERLKRHGKYKDMTNYREVYGSLHTYIDQWEKLEQHGLEPNLISQGDISFVSAADQAYQDASLLYDGLGGFVSDYHQGWVINRGDPWELAVQLPSGASSRVLEMRFLNIPKHGILAPEQVKISDGDQLLYTLVPIKLTESLYRIRVAVDFPKKTTAVRISIFKSKVEGKSTVALDEIKLIK
ncbi:DUF4838 domain-containing protein [Galbibacter sp.]|uniref:DUF4838 domain-containing protein n=1 Tax=Galbibacter sp. TaxID=2918471 RepID=UPI003A8DD047